MLAEYACNPANTKGRLYKEDSTPYRNEFERDRDRIIHSNGFRRLQYKTQVFINESNDHYRNRSCAAAMVEVFVGNSSRIEDATDEAKLFAMVCIQYVEL